MWSADSLIDGELVCGSGARLVKESPVDGRRLGEVVDDPLLAGRALAVARSRCEEWGLTAVSRRAQVLERFASLLVLRAEEVCGAIYGETGKSMADARAEFEATLRMVRFMAGEGERFYGITLPSANPRRTAEIRRRPLGLVTALVSFNTPAANFAWKVCPALLCGNTVVLKPSEHTPYTALLLGKIFLETGAPAGVLSVVQGGVRVGACLVRDERSEMVSFTGSARVGLEIGKICAERAARCALELGGNNAMIVCADADISAAIDCALLSAFSNAGQRCAALSRLLVDESIYDVFRDRFLAKASRLRVASRNDCDFGPVISRGAYQEIVSKVALRQANHSVRILLGKEMDTVLDGEGGFCLPPIVLEGDFDDSEIFGPVVTMRSFASNSEALSVANESRFGLTAAVHTASMKTAHWFEERLRVGIVSINGNTYGSEPNMPFGGYGHSGNGWKDAGTAALDTYSMLQGIYRHF